MSDIEARIEETVTALNVCAQERSYEIEELRNMLCQPPALTEEQIEALAERAAKKAVEAAAHSAASLALELMERNMQLRVGKFVLSNVYVVIGAVVIAGVSWMAGKGLIRI